MEVIRAFRNKQLGSVAGIKSTEISYKDGRVETYSLIRGAIVFPHQDYPGITLLALRPLGSEVVEVIEEKPFTDIVGAIEVLDELSAYLPSLYYYDENAESEGFISYLRRATELQGKIPLVPAYHPDAVDYGLRLIQDFLTAERLKLPTDGILASQLQTGRHESPVEEVYGITAIRYLLAGIKEVPWEKELEEFSLESCLA
jgi:hypothetical protein